MRPITKFPEISDTIFTVVSKIAQEHNAVNLGQGFPNFDCDPYLFERLNYYTHSGANQYAPASGMPALKNSIVDMHNAAYGGNLNAETEVSVCSGATEGILSAVCSVVRPGDEVIVFDPAYDSYLPAIRINYGVPVVVRLNKDFSIDWDLLAKRITTRTKLIMLNSPHNPSGKVLTKTDLDSLWELVENTDIVILCDEVYQHIIFDGKKHLSPFNDSRMRDRTFAVSSFGKTFHVTGWKIGYCLAPPLLMNEFMKVHQYNTFCAMTACQLALSDFMGRFPNWYRDLAEVYESKRNLFKESIASSKFELLPVEGSYFQCVDYSRVSDKNDWDFCVELISKYGIATIPLSKLYYDPPKQKLLRLCFAKTEDVLLKAADCINSV